MKIDAQLEQTEHLTKDEFTAVAIIAATINTRCDTLDKAMEWCSNLCGWFVYRGGHHIAVHLQPNDPRRILLVAETK